MFIYKWTNLENGKIYIGLTSNINSRLRAYKTASKKPRTPIEYALRKYYYNFNDVNDIKNQFKFEVVDKAKNYEELNQKEIDWIEFYKSLGYVLYNLTIGGEGAVGNKHSEETKIKMSLAQKGRIVSDETKKQISKTLKGKKHSKERRKKISETRKGYITSEETKKKLSLAAKEYWKNRKEV